MISLKSNREIEIMKEAGKILASVFDAVQPVIAPGVTTAELDRIAEETIRSGGGKPAFKGYKGFPGTACISVNDEVVHGIPGERELADGDLISVDCGVHLNGYFVDAARTWIVGEADALKQRIVDTARLAFEEGVRQCRPGNRIGDISEAIQRYIEGAGFGVVRDFVGHGIGRNIHEDPQVPNYGKKGRGPRIEPGLCIAIEPMVTEGGYAVKILDDGWTVATCDGKFSSHYEDTLVITENGPEIITRS